MSSLTFSPGAWAARLAKSTTRERAEATAALFSGGGSLEFRSSADALLRTIAFGAWTVVQRVNTYAAVPGEYTDTAVGEGMPAVAVFKNSSGQEVFRCSAGTGSNFYELLAALKAGIPVERGDFDVEEPDVPGDIPVDPATVLRVANVPASIDLTQGETYALAQHVLGGILPLVFSSTELPSGVTMDDDGLLSASESATVALSGDVLFTVKDSEVEAPPDTGQAPENAVLPEIVGEPAVGQTLTSTNGEWLNDPTSFTRQWYRNDVFIGATSVTYTLAAQDEGQMITVRVTATNSVDSTVAISDPPVGPVQGAPAGEPLANISPPTVSVIGGGALAVGATLSVSNGTWSGSPTSFSRQWMRGDTPVSNANGSSYLLGEPDDGELISCFVTARNGVDENSVMTAKVGPIITVAADTKPVSGSPPRLMGGIAEVGYTVRVFEGSWFNEPTGFTYQWRRSGIAISGANGPEYMMTDADLGKDITVSVVAHNAAGASAARTSNAYWGATGALVRPVACTQTQRPTLYSDMQPMVLGRPRVGEALNAKVMMWNNFPDRHRFQWLRNGSPISDATQSYYWVQQADLGARISCIITAINPIGETSITTAQTAAVTAARVAPPVVLPEFGLISEVGGSNLPFSFAHAFVKGDVPAGKVALLSGLSTFQSVPISTYPDGSTRLAWISGRATLTAGVKAKWQVVIGNAPTGTAPTLAALRSALTSGSVQVGDYETIDLPALIAGAPADIFGNGNAYIFQGPQCSYWIWRKRVAGTPHLELFVPIRFFAGGAIQIDIPWLQNGDLLVPGPQVYDPLPIKVTLNGSVRYDQIARVLSRSTLPLVLGKSVDYSYWYGTNPKVRPAHDMIYLRKTGLVPNYRDDIPPTNAKLDSRPQTYVMNWLGQVDSTDPTHPGTEAIGILPMWGARWVTSNGDARAYDCAMANGLASGSRQTHFRDGGGYGKNTGLYFKPSDYPRTILNNSSSVPWIPMPSTGNGRSLDQAHQPAWDYVPWIASGSIFFLEEMQAFTGWNYLDLSYSGRYDAEGRISYGAQTRGVAWSIRTLGHLCASLPDTHALRSDWLRILSNNIDWNYGLWVDGTRGSGEYSGHKGAGVHSNPLGFVDPQDGWGQYVDPGDIGPYAGQVRYGPPWMAAFVGMAFKSVKDANLPMSPATKARLDGVMRHVMMLSIQRTGGMGSTWPWTLFDMYVMPTRENRNTGGRWLKSVSESYSLYAAGWGAPVITSQPPAGSEMVTVFGKLRHLASTDWTLASRVISLYALLVEATEEGMPEAAERLALVQSSPSFSTAAMPSDPGWSLKPRAGS